MLPIVPGRHANDLISFVFSADFTSAHSEPGGPFAGNSAVILKSCNSSPVKYGTPIGCILNKGEFTSCVKAAKQY